VDIVLSSRFVVVGISTGVATIVNSGDDAMHHKRRLNQNQLACNEIVSGEPLAAKMRRNEKLGFDQVEPARDAPKEKGLAQHAFRSVDCHATDSSKRGGE
jgi:hypothetical protein